MLFDGVIVPGGSTAMATLADNALAKDFLRQQHRHAKTMLAIGDGVALFEAAGIPRSLPDGKPDPGIIAPNRRSKADPLAAFVKALARHRHYERESDPPAA